MLQILLFRTILAGHTGFRRGAVVVDEKTAWEFFRSTGSIRDYLNYTQCRANSEQMQSKREERHEDRRPRSGGFGEARG